MIESFSGLEIHSLLGDLFAQIPEPNLETPEEAALIFSGPQFFIALLSGLVLTFGFQLLLTNLSVAAGISYIGHSSSSSSSKNGRGEIGVALGIWTLITVSLALFFACFLAVKLSLYSSILLGAITGLVIWGTYFCLLFWVSATTVGSLIGSVVKTATSSFQSLVGTATAALAARSAGNQVVETAEATVAAVRNELAKGWNGDEMKETVRDYLMSLRSPTLETEGLEAEFERLIREADLSSVADQDTLTQLDRGSFEELVSRRTDLSRQEVKRVANRLYLTWQRAVGQASNRNPLAELSDYLRTARPDELIAERVGDRLDQLIAEYRQQRRQQQTGPLSQGLNTLIGIVMGRTDLSDFDVEKIVGRLKQLQAQAGEQVSALTQTLSDQDSGYSVVKADVENYLLNAYPWQLKPMRLKQEFWDVIYDPHADPGVLRFELMGLNRPYFADVLQSRGLLTQAEIARTSQLLDEVLQQALAELGERYRLESAKALQEKIYTFSRRTPREELLSDMGAHAFRELLNDPYAEAEDLRVRFSPFGYEAFLQTLRTRPEIHETEAEQIAQRMKQIMEQTLADAEGLKQAAQTRIDHQWQDLQNYLRQTEREELNPEGIKSDLQTLMHEPDAGIHRLRQRLAQFDRDTLVQLLSQRQDLSEADVEHILNQVEATWYQTIHAPAALTAQAQAKYDEATSAIATYLRETGKPELNPEGIKRDLNLLLEKPKVGFQAMRERLAAMDRDTLVQLLSQRDDLTEAEVNQIIDDILDTIREIVRMPQRLARRAKAQVLSFEQALEDYLRSTNKVELNPTGIKRDLRLLLDDPRLGRERIQTRLSQMDRDTLVALLAQRDDMTREEAEAAVDRVLEVRDQILAQVRSVKERVESAIASILDRIRLYLDSLGRPELNYYGIKQDLHKLMDDPQAGFEALRVRLGQFDRETLVAILSSHDAISKADANRVIDQIEDVRDSVLRKAEQLERAVENRVQEIKYQAQQQIDETRKSAEVAAWWIFGTATVSAICAAVAGGLAVAG